VRCDWEEANELIAAATVHAIREYGPDRVGGFTPIPAMSPVSFAAGSRFLSLIGGHTTTFYDWYADLPPAAPQVFGDQTDVPESADWWDASYLVIWGTNLPITRTPDAHFMTEARYRGQKVVVVSPDYSDHVKFADDWLPAQPGTDGALAMAMGLVAVASSLACEDSSDLRASSAGSTSSPATSKPGESGGASGMSGPAEGSGGIPPGETWRTLTSGLPTTSRTAARATGI